jgi:DNA-binding transcriptional regulator YiaG
VKARRGLIWNGVRIRELRRHLGLTQSELAKTLGTRQQTISEWETEAYRPRGASATLLTIIAERAGFAYEPSTEQDRTAEKATNDN